MLGIGIIGVGGMGSFHARTIAHLAGARVVAVSDPSTGNTSAIRDELGAEVIDDPYELIASGALEAVVIASPDDTHAEFAVAALGAGLHVLCEKPLATDVESARLVLDAEIALGTRRIQLGFMREYDPAHACLHDPGVGRIDHLHAVHRNANAVPRPVADIVGQSLVHDVHTVRFVTGDEIVSVDASGSGATIDRIGATTYRHILVMCRLAGGGHAMLEFDDCAFGYDVGVELVGADGDLVIGRPPRATRRRDASTEQFVGTDWFGRFADAYRLQDAAWVDSIRRGEPTGPSVWDGYAAQCVADAITHSLAVGERVDVDLPERPALYG